MFSLRLYCIIQGCRKKIDITADNSEWSGGANNFPQTQNVLKRVLITNRKKHRSCETARRTGLGNWWIKQSTLPAILLPYTAENLLKDAIDSVKWAPLAGTHSCLSGMWRTQYYATTVAGRPRPDHRESRRGGTRLRSGRPFFSKWQV